MANEGFEVEEWDADFLDQLVQAEELALSSATQLYPPPPPLPPPPYAADISYSPPRELSQRIVHDIPKGFDHFPGENHRGAHNQAKDQEIDKLKKELGRVSKQLTQLEQECLKLKKERGKKEEKLKSVNSRIEAIDDEFRKNNTNLGHGANINTDPQISSECQNTTLLNERARSSINVGTSACKAVGVQTDSYEAKVETVKHNLPSPTNNCSKKLLSLWDPQSGRILVSKLLVSCEADFQTLFGCMNLSLPYEVHKSSLALGGPLLDSTHSAETVKISHLYSMLTKFSEESVRLKDLVEALVSLCRLENIDIIHRSLRILHVVLKYSFTLRNYDTRENVIFEEPFSDNTTKENKNPLFNYVLSHTSKVPVCNIEYISLFELMSQISRTSKEEYIRFEAVSIMNIILIRSNAYMEREKFASEKVLQSISQLLKKEAGSCVQMQALRLLYLLLNCPKVMAIFSSACKEEEESVDMNANSIIFEGLADCIACSGTGAQELKLRRNAINLLAFLVSSGKSSFEILFNPSLSRMTHLLATILRGLSSDMDLEAVIDPVQPPEIVKERTLLMRETLILLNRLVSHPRYSGPVLRGLTSRREMASLTIEIANRLSVKGKCLRKDDIITRQNSESEILELARVFKKRVFTFLGENIL